MVTEKLFVNRYVVRRSSKHSDGNSVVKQHCDVRVWSCVCERERRRGETGRVLLKYCVTFKTISSVGRAQGPGDAWMSTDITRYKTFARIRYADTQRPPGVCTLCYVHALRWKHLGHFRRPRSRGRISRKYAISSGRPYPVRARKRSARWAVRARVYG